MIKTHGSWSWSAHHDLQPYDKASRALSINLHTCPVNFVLFTAIILYVNKISNLVPGSKWQRWDMDSIPEAWDNPFPDLS